MTMRILFSSQDLWDLVENGYQEPANVAAYNALSQVDKDLLKDNRKKDSKALFFIFEGMDEIIFPRIATATEFKQAWDIPQIVYQRMKKVNTVGNIQD